MKGLRKLFGSRKRKVAVVAVLALLIAASTAFAVWYAQGSGSGNSTGRLDNATPLTLNIVAGTTPAQGSADAFGPGETGKMYFDIGNPNNGTSVRITNIVKSGAATITGAAGPGVCNIDSFLTLGTQTNTPAENWYPNATTGDILAPGDNNGGFVYVNLGALAPGDCAGGAVTMPVTVTAVPVP